MRYSYFMPEQETNRQGVSKSTNVHYESTWIKVFSNVFPVLRFPTCETFGSFSAAKVAQLATSESALLASRAELGAERTEAFLERRAATLLEAEDENFQAHVTHEDI